MELVQFVWTRMLMTASLPQIRQPGEHLTCLTPSDTANHVCSMQFNWIWTRREFYLPMRWTTSSSHAGQRNVYCEWSHNHYLFSTTFPLICSTLAPLSFSFTDYCFPCFFSELTVINRIALILLQNHAMLHPLPTLQSVYSGSFPLSQYIPPTELMHSCIQ